MANVFEKGTKFAATALALLKRTVKAPGLFVHKYGIADFRGAEGDVVNVKRPPLLRARDKGWRSSNAIIVDNLTQSKIQVKLTAFPYSAVHLSPEESTLDDVDYVRDIQSPQVTAIVEFYEELIVATLSEADFVFEVGFNPEGSGAIADPRKVALRARKYFQDAKVPTGGRFWLVGSSVSEAIAGHSDLLAVDTSGLPEALREGVVGKLGGFIVVEMDALDENESYFAHETAIALAQVAPVVPKGAIGGATINEGGMALTQIWDYDSVNAKDRSIVESFAGAAPVLDPETDDEGNILIVGDEVKMAFFRAIKVSFGAPDAAEGNVWTSQITGAPTGGTWTLTADGEETADIAFDASNGDIADALNALDGIAGAKVKGSGTKTITFTEPVLLTETASLTGGTTPDVTVTKVS
tara:strand:- start:14175 stop:15407 length:1233 start_codon:yes stop_codon:yes gene_type:complete